MNIFQEFLKLKKANFGLVRTKSIINILSFDLHIKNLYHY